MSQHPPATRKTSKRPSGATRTRRSITTSLPSRSSARDARASGTASNSAAVNVDEKTTTSPAEASGATAVRILLSKPRSLVTNRSAQLLAVTMALVFIGLVMVLSSSAVEEFAIGNSVSSKFITQTVSAIIGIVAMIVAASMPARIWQRLAWPMLVLAVIVQLLVFTPLGYSVGENRAWIRLGGFSFQPAELVKVALVVVLAKQFEMHRRLERSARQLFVPLAVALVPSVGLVLLGKDLGTVLVIGALVLGAMWFGEVNWKYIGACLVAAAVGAVAVALTSPLRVARMLCFINQSCDYETDGWQSTHAMYALAAGGLTGRGLGMSRAKWSWLPAADNDFIFAIIGEEYGFLGASVVIGLFVVLALVLLGIINSTKDRFARTVCGAVLVWLVFQAFVNIAVVLGLLPILGVPLPFVSSGGSALMTTLLAVGIVLSVAKTAADPKEDA